MGLLPVLKPAGWDGPSFGALAHLWLGSVAEPEVVVGYRDTDTDTDVDAATDADADAGDWALRPEDGNGATDGLIRTAFANLERCEVDTELLTAAGATMLVSAGHTHTAEKVLSERFMLEVHRALDAEVVLVSLAVRGALMACADGSATTAKATLAGLHLEAWSNADEQHRITDRLVVFERGRKSGLVEVSPEGVMLADEPTVDNRLDGAVSG